MHKVGTAAVSSLGHVLRVIYVAYTRKGETVSGQLQNMSVSQIRAKAREDAGVVLQRLWPAGVLPIDPIFVARGLGLSVFRAQLGDDAWGMLVGASGGASIYLDQDQPMTRYRFSCAHEIGHFIDRGSDMEAENAFVDRRSDDSKGRADEIYANEFAGSLLMPEQELLRAILAGETDFDLAARFDVSLEAVRYRRRLMGV